MLVETGTPDTTEKQRPEEFQIQIDRNHYTVHEPVLTGEQIRHVPSPPIGPDRDLWEVVPGGADRKIGNNDEVQMKNGLRFFTAPAQINPGRFSGFSKGCNR
jgi:hypothetical protein